MQDKNKINTEKTILCFKINPSLINILFSQELKLILTNQYTKCKKSIIKTGIIYGKGEAIFPLAINYGHPLIAYLQVKYSGKCISFGGFF